MDAADLTTLRPEPFRAAEEADGTWLVLDATGEIVATCEGVDAWRNACAIAGSLAIGSGFHKHPETTAAEEEMEEEQRRADLADQEREDAKKREAAEEAKRKDAEALTERETKRADDLNDQLHEATEKLELAHEQLANLVRSLRYDDRERRLAIDQAYDFLDAHAPAHRVQRPEART